MILSDEHGEKFEAEVIAGSRNLTDQKDWEPYYTLKPIKNKPKIKSVGLHLWGLDDKNKPDELFKEYMYMSDPTAKALGEALEQVVHNVTNKPDFKEGVTGNLIDAVAKARELYQKERNNGNN